jgi:hypothetical protein
MQNWYDTKSFQTSAQGLIDGVDRATLGWELWFKAVSRCQLEMMSLASRRAQAYMELPACIGACRAPHDLIGEQANFWRTAATQYAETWGRVADDFRLLTPAPWSFWNSLKPAGAQDKETAEKQERDYMPVREAEDARRQGSRRAA